TAIFGEQRFENDLKVVNVWHGLILKYSLNMCHQCFWQYVKDIGFIKLD
uniref:40S ribosomal protein S29 n=1 Tax=Vombatus ursinus TaxID=29139 RepID=A0A4X2KN51_VOMUR